MNALCRRDLLHMRSLKLPPPCWSISAFTPARLELYVTFLLVAMATRHPALCCWIVSTYWRRFAHALARGYKTHKHIASLCF